MNVFGEKKRSWRKARKRGVSPIIATILLVAITVVLAAVLYVLISGLTRGPGNTPIGTAFHFGAATLEESASATDGCAATHYCYIIQIASVSGVSTSDLQFGMTTVSGASTGFTEVSLWAPAATAASSTWTSPGTGPATGGTVSIAGSDYFVLDTGLTGPSTPSGAGYSLVAFGVGSFSSSTSTNLP